MPCKCHRSSLPISLPNINISNAGDLVEEYWAKNPKKKAAAARKSLDKKSPKKPRKSVAAEDSSDAGHTSTKKRGRKSSTKAFVESDEMDVDEVAETRAPKKARKTTQTSKATKMKTATPESEQKMIGTMESYLHMEEWDGLVKSVDTVEREGDNNLVVYFTL
jgi:chromobox protein 5